ncbi:MAG: vitamin K epoxide reductase family protein [Desulfobacterales bacterium]|nr:vitamin K epoxide reductase family protein [Desulfobacterales bacterium]
MARRRAKKVQPVDKGRSGARNAARVTGDAVKNRPGPHWPVLALSLAGGVLTAYLSFSSWFGTALVYCEEGSGCDVVQHSAWGTFLGVPTAFWGFLGYVFLAGIAYKVRQPEKRWKWLWTFSLIGLAVSAYLTVISFTVLQTACSYCLASLTLMGTIFLTVSLQRPKTMPQTIWSAWAGQRVVLAALIIGGLQLHYSGVFSASKGSEDPFLKALAVHLTGSKAVFYGAFW